MVIAARLSAAELDEIAAFLGTDDAPETRMPGAACEGFLAGILCSPELVPPSEWLPVVLGETDGPAFASIEEARRITTLLMRWYNELARQLYDAPHEFEPVIGDETGAFNAGAAIIWALGFFDAIRLRIDDWKPFFDGDGAASILPILALVECADKPKNWKRKATTAGRKLPEAVADIYAYWLEQRSKPKLRAVPKVGRNEPCPCGSGRKFKRCCGDRSVSDA